jgi:hypothetical protein
MDRPSPLLHDYKGTTLSVYVRLTEEFGARPIAPSVERASSSHLEQSAKQIAVHVQGCIFRAAKTPSDKCDMNKRRHPSLNMEE